MAYDIWHKFSHMTYDIWNKFLHMTHDINCYTWHFVNHGPGFSVPPTVLDKSPTFPLLFPTCLLHVLNMSTTFSLHFSSLSQHVSYMSGLPPPLYWLLSDKGIWEQGKDQQSATALLCIGSACTALHYTSLHFTALQFTAVHCTALHCTALFCTALH